MASSQYGFVAKLDAYSVLMSETVPLMSDSAFKVEGSTCKESGEALRKFSSEKFKLNTFPSFSDSVKS